MKAANAETRKLCFRWKRLPQTLFTKRRPLETNPTTKLKLNWTHGKWIEIAITEIPSNFIFTNIERAGSFCDGTFLLHFE